jgi:hypothetical protein
MENKSFTLQEAGLVIMVVGGATGAATALLGATAGRDAGIRVGSGIGIFSQGLGLFLSAVGDINDRGLTYGDFNPQAVRANLDASGKLLLGSGFMLGTVPIVLSLTLQDNKVLYGSTALLTVAGSACLGIAQDKGGLMNWK